MPLWILDTSSLIGVRSTVTRAQATVIYEGLTRLVIAGRLRFPKELLVELERYRGAENPALAWANEQQGSATVGQPSFAEVKAVLASVPEVLDPDKEGVEEADPYVLAMAYSEKLRGTDVRIVTEEFKTTVAKMNLTPVLT